MTTRHRTIAVRGGLVVSATDQRRTDLLIEDGTVVATGTDSAADLVIDATDLIVLPGGVDTHVHLMDPGDTSREDFPAGTSAAAARGVTTIVEHTHGHPVTSVDVLTEKRAHLADRSNVDFALAAHTWPDKLDRIGDLSRAGVAFFKIFTCTTHGVPGLDAGNLVSALTAMSEVGAPALIHCEDETITAVAERVLRNAGRDDNGLLVEWRNRDAELAATAAAASLAALTGVTATIAHVSSPDVAAVITDARRRGADVVAEACPQYFTLRESEVEEHGALRKFTPPARIRDDAEEAAMWDLVRDGTYAHFSTDHAPSTMEQKSAGGIWEAPFGLPGLDTTFPFLIDAALHDRITLSDVARLYAAAPAARYGLAPRKGGLDVGSDADFVLVDPSTTWTVRAADVLSKAGWSPYEGRRFRGTAVATYLRGEEIAAGGTVHDQRRGRFVPGGGVEH